jgi:flagellar export protein FliJ
MKKFDFRLERVLELRRLEADLEQARLAAQENNLDSLRRQITQLDDDYCRERDATSGNPLEREQLNWFRQAYESRRRQAEAEVHAQEQRLARQREATIAARQKVEVLEKVKQKQRKDWERQLQKELDEAAMDSFLAKWTPPAARRPS